MILLHGMLECIESNYLTFILVWLWHASSDNISGSIHST